MLVLAREVEQAIIIGGTIRVKVMEVRGGKVRLGVDAPGLTVDREEIHQAKLAAVNRGAKGDGGVYVGGGKAGGVRPGVGDGVGGSGVVDAVGKR